MSASARFWWAIIALTVRAALARHLRVAPLALLALLSAVSPAAALSAEERALVGRVERYLGDLQALAAPFIQVSSAGKMARGRLYLWRPGRLRFEYDPPTPIGSRPNRTCRRNRRTATTTINLVYQASAGRSATANGPIHS